MKSLRVVGRVFLLPIVCLFIAGCATGQRSSVNVGYGPRFHEASNANVVLRFASWEYTFLVQPEYREDGYYHQLRHDDIAPTLGRMTGPRDLAVVTVGWGYKPEQLEKIVSDWKTLLAGCGFRRVVVVRATMDYEINGAIIVDDSLAAISTSRPTASL